MLARETKPEAQAVVAGLEPLGGQWELVATPAGAHAQRGDRDLVHEDADELPAGDGAHPEGDGAEVGPLAPDGDVEATADAVEPGPLAVLDSARRQPWATVGELGDAAPPRRGGRRDGTQPADVGALGVAYEVQVDDGR